MRPAMPADVDHHLRIGELSRRTGIKPELLRAWERRYGLLQPERTAGGLRLYSADDERRIRLMQDRLEQGLSAAEAARLVLAGDDGLGSVPAAPTAGVIEQQTARLREALDRFAAAEANDALDRLIASVSLDVVLAEAVLPYLHELGVRWAEGEVSVAQEHFATNLLRTRLAGLARGWERGSGPLALLACAPGEQHDLPLMIFGLALRGRGWRIAYLGPDTPGDSLRETAATLDPAIVVVTAVARPGFDDAAGELASVASERPVALAGAGVDAELAESLGCIWLSGDPVSAAGEVARRR